jgi:hypothetical protein
MDAVRFQQEIVAGQKPVVLRGLVRDWAAVRASQQGPEALCGYLMQFDRGGTFDAVMMPPDARGRLFYSPDMKSFNFARSKRTVSQVIEQVARYSQFESAPAVAMQSALLDECLPGFAAANPQPLLDAAARPRLWLGVLRCSRPGRRPTCTSGRWTSHLRRRQSAWSISARRTSNAFRISAKR